MAKVRVSTLAKEFGMTSKELMGHLADMKIPAKSASSALEDAYVAMVRKQLAPVIEARAQEVEAAKQAEEQAAAAEEAARAAEAERERERTLARVSQATGVPAALIHGDDEESMTASAKAVADFAESRQPGYPLDKGGSGGGKKVNKESIESIKDPAKRIMARAAHMDLYK